jgi:UDP-galactopyranose mutase
MSLTKNRVLVVGAGFSGAVVARELAEQGFAVTVIDKRSHLGGNAFDYVNAHGIRVHAYGPHLFHTSNTEVVNWLSRFTEWLPYQHRVKALLADGRLVTLPVNAETAEIVGKENVLDVFFRPYTLKMWGVPLEALDPGILDRVPIRSDMNELYFPNDRFQAMPAKGYTAIFERIFDHPGITVSLGVTFDPVMEREYSHVFNSMPIDEYFKCSHGELPYRSIRFHNHNLPVPSLFPVATVNFTHSGPHTRVTEWKKLPNHGDNPLFTSITVEEPCDYRDNNYERYYPVKDLHGKNRELFNRYRAMAPENMTFIGRCGLYAYLDMHQAISSALEISKRFLKS